MEASWLSFAKGLGRRPLNRLFCYAFLSHSKSPFLHFGVTKPLRCAHPKRWDPVPSKLSPSDLDSNDAEMSSEVVARQQFASHRFFIVVRQQQQQQRRRRRRQRVSEWNDQREPMNRRQALKRSAATTPPRHPWKNGTSRPLSLAAMSMFARQFPWNKFTCLSAASLTSRQCQLVSRCMAHEKLQRTLAFRFVALS